jgi:hypothetical protein
MNFSERLLLNRNFIFFCYILIVYFWHTLKNIIFTIGKMVFILNSQFNFFLRYQWIYSNHWIVLVWNFKEWSIFFSILRLCSFNAIIPNAIRSTTLLHLMRQRLVQVQIVSIPKVDCCRAHWGALHFMY